MSYLHPIYSFSACFHENSSITLWRIANKNHMVTSLYLEARILAEKVDGVGLWILLIRYLSWTPCGVLK
jgi:hypothetical protein